MTCRRLPVRDGGRQVALGDPREVLHDPSVFPVAKVTGLGNVVIATVREHLAEEGLTLADWSDGALDARRHVGHLSQGQVLPGRRIRASCPRRPR